MKLLDGGRILALCHPGEGLSRVLENLVDRLQERGIAPHQVYKVLVFLSRSNDHGSQYQADPGAIRELSGMLRAAIQPELLVVPLYQPPLNSPVVVEAHYYDALRWSRCQVNTDRAGAQVFRNRKTVLSCGAVHIPGKHIRKTAEEAFHALNDLLAASGFSFPQIVRQWHYIEDILGRTGDAAHYQVFNEVRSRYYAAHLGKGQYPAATGIGMQAGGMVIEYIAAEGPGLINTAMDNPCQIPAYQYSTRVSRAVPKFERGRTLSHSGQQITFVSGTASIRGEQTMYPGNTAKQTELTMENLDHLLAGLQAGKPGSPHACNKFDYLRIYLKDRKDYAPVQVMLHEKYGAVPAVWLQADICRKDLMIEIEGTISETSEEGA